MLNQINGLCSLISELSNCFVDTEHPSDLHSIRVIPYETTGQWISMCKMDTLPRVIRLNESN